jgi:hypothetical protein
LGGAWPASLQVLDFATSYDTHCAPVTSMIVRVVDQSELVGLLVDLHGHGVLLQSLEHLENS